MGGLDKRALAESKAAIEREVDKARRAVKLGRYIPGFDHLIPPDVPWDNFRYAAQQLRRVCCDVA
jgi:uroporphyrinogen decarboxylase